MSTRVRDAAGGGAAAMRGFLLIGVAVLLGAALLVNSYGDGASGPLDTSSRPTPSTVHGTPTTGATGATDTTAPPVSHAPAAVKVLVLNGTGKAGVAKAGGDVLKAANFTVLDPGDATANVAASIVYAAPGFEADGAVIAQLLGLPPTAVQPLTSPAPAEIGDIADAVVVAVLGPDSAAAGGAATTAPAN